MTIRESNIILEGKNSEPATFSEEGIIQQTYIDKTQDDDMYKKFGIIQNQIYFIKLKDDDRIIQGCILNFNYSKYFIKAYDGHYVVDIDEIKLLKPSNLTKEKYEEKCLKYLEKHV